MRFRIRHALCLVPLLVLAACAAAREPSEEAEGSTTEAATFTGTVLVALDASAPINDGRMQNGRMQNGRMQNGRMQNGRMQNGADLSLAGVDLKTMKRLLVLPAAGQEPNLDPSNLVAVPNVRLFKSMLSDDRKSGTAFAGHVVYGKLSDGTADVPVYIEQITQNAADPELFDYVLKAYHPFRPLPGDTCEGNCPVQWDYACGTHLTPRKLCIPPASTNGAVATGVPACDPGNHEVPNTAIAVGGQWDYHEGHPGDGSKVIDQSSPLYDTQVTFACGDGAIGKCATVAGYKPWALAGSECRTITVPRPIRKCWSETREHLHESCVRMVRADYCGDGTSHTVDGVGIDVWDESKINRRAGTGTSADGGIAPDAGAIVNWDYEAEWTPRGARCLHSEYFAGRTSRISSILDYVKNACPHKWDGQFNQKDKFGVQVPFEWDNNDCFEVTTESSTISARSDTFHLANTPSDPTGAKSTTMDLQDRVYLMNTSMCLTSGWNNPDAQNAICLKPLPLSQLEMAPGKPAKP